MKLSFWTSLKIILLLQARCPFVSTCPAGEVKCRDGSCIAGVQVCDGVTDCAEGEDETACKEAQCYADSGLGSVKVQCGKQTSPCKYLDQCFNSRNHKEVIVQGKHVFHNPIAIRHNVSIRGDVDALMTGPSTVAFEVMEFVFVNITSIQFQGIGLVNLRHRSDVIISSCSVHNVNESKNIIFIDKSVSQTSVRLYSSSFKDNGGSVLQHVSSPNRSIAVVIEDCSFDNNTNGVILRGHSVQSVCLSNNKFSNIPCGILSMTASLHSFSRVIVSGNTFIEQEDFPTSCKYSIIDIDGVTNVSVKSNIFQRFSAAGIDQVRTKKSILVRSVGRISVENCTFAKNYRNKITYWDNPRYLWGDFDTFDGNSIAIFQSGRSVITKCSFANSTVNRSGGSVTLKNIQHSSIISECIFTGNGAKAKGGAIYMDRVMNSLISNCSFTNNAANTGGAIAINKGSTRITNTFFRNNAAKGGFAKCAGGSIYLLGGEEKGIEISLENSMFISNQAVEGGAILVEKQWRSFLVKTCVFNNNSATQGGAVALKEHAGAVLSRNIFSSNHAVYGGAVYVFLNTYKTSNEILKSIFINNTGLVLGQSIFSTANMKVEDIYLQATETTGAYHVYSSYGYFVMPNIKVNLSRATGVRQSKSRAIFVSTTSIYMDRGLQIDCPIGFNAELINSSYFLFGAYVKYTFMQLDCVSCPYNRYNLHRGELFLDRLEEQSTRQNPPKITNHKCLTCPSGAICDIDVRSVDNYWGYNHSQSDLSFELCPSGYCCSAETRKCTTYDTCAEGRSGTLCGSCAEGYKQSFLTSDCIPQGEECESELFIVYIVFYSFAYTLVFVGITNAQDIIQGVKDFFTSRKMKDGNPEDEDEGNKICTRDRSSSDERQNEQFSMSGFVQIITLYFQVASLLRVKFQDGASEVRSSDKTKNFVANMFNFRFAVYQGLCPSDNLTLPQKEMMLFGIKLVTLLHLSLIYMSVKIFKQVRARYKKPSRSPVVMVEDFELASNGIEGKGRRDDDTTDDDMQDNLTFCHRIKLTFIKLIKLYFTPVTKAALQMTHCVPILDSSRLFVFGDHVCYSSWQIFILVVILPSLLLFPVCFETSLRLLKKKAITSTNFVLALAFPYYGMILHFYKQRKERSSEAENTTEPDGEHKFVQVVLESEEQLFVVEDGSFGWQIVQLYRTIVINVLTVFITNPFYRSLTFIPVLLAFVVHDTVRQPYKHERLNQLQALSSRFLLIILACNIAAGVSFMVDVTTTPHMLQVVLPVVTIVEMLMYAIVPLSLPLRMVWALVKDKYYSSKKQR